MKTLFAAAVLASTVSTSTAPIQITLRPDARAQVDKCTEQGGQAMVNVNLTEAHPSIGVFCFYRTNRSTEFPAQGMLVYTDSLPYTGPPAH